MCAAFVNAYVAVMLEVDHEKLQIQGGFFKYVSKSEGSC